MRRRADFTAAVRSGRRASSPSLVVHVTARPDVDEPARFGLVVSRSVGGSVVRHRVARQIRSACGSRLADFSAGDLVVVRALPAAAGARSSQLAADFDQAVGRLGHSRALPAGAA
jgi:ribonuclease P protein component